MELLDREKYWLLREAWTYLGYDKPNEAYAILNYLDHKFKDDIEIQKMLLVASLRSKDYQKTLNLAEYLLQSSINDIDKHAVYLCQIDALSNLGLEDYAQKVRDLFFMDKNL